MSKFKSSLIPLEVDVWNVIEEELKTGIKEILSVGFSYIAETKQTFVVIKHVDGSGPDIITPEGENLITKLCERFNIPTQNLNRLNFHLVPGEVPTFLVGLYPYVDDESTLDNTKSRMNPITID